MAVCAWAKFSSDLCYEKVEENWRTSAILYNCRSSDTYLAFSRYTVPTKSHLDIAFFSYLNIQDILGGAMYLKANMDLM